MTHSAMGDERRWAARYQFLEQLWRGRNRIICDRELEGALHAGLEGPLAVLLEDLIPGDGGDASAWVALHNDRRAASFARAHSGTVFVALDDAAELASEEDWKVAVVNLDSEEGPGHGPAIPQSPQIEAFLEILGERAEDKQGRSVILTRSCGPDEDACYEQLAELVEELFQDARIYGLTRPSMLAFYDFGPVLEAEDAEGDTDVEIEVDNTLGTPTPRFEAFIAVVGAMLPGEGLTFVELPVPTAEGPREVAGPGTTRAETEELTAMRAQLAEAQRRGDMHAIERQALLEQLEQAEDRIAGLDEALESSQADPNAAPDTASSEGLRLDAALAREQSLRWELDRLRGELENVRARPVEALEAEVASLQLELERAEAEAELDELDETHGGRPDGHAEASPGEGAEPDIDEPTPAQAREWMKARSKLEHLLHKLERGGQLSALELHRELSALRRSL